MSEETDIKPSEDSGSSSGGVQQVTRTTVTLQDILRMFSAPKVIEYLSLDIEGAEHIVLENFPFDEYTFLSLSVERPKDSLVAQLKENGYVYLKDHGPHGDQFYIHSSLPSADKILKKYSVTGGGGDGGSGAAKDET